MTNLLFWGNIIGYVGLVLIYIQVVFGSRHIFKIFSRDTVFLNKVHKQIGIYGIFFVFAHPLFEMMNRSQDLSWLIMPNFDIETETHITFGRFATILFLIIWLTSAMIREKIKWRPWKYIHLLSYPILFFTFIHILEIGTFFENYAFVKIIYVILFISFILSLIMRLFAWSGITKIKYKIIDKKMIGEDILYIQLESINNKSNPTPYFIRSKIGQHFFLQTDNFKSEHPFSVIKNEVTEGVSSKISFAIRKVGKFWEEMINKNIGDIILVDGAYGVFTKEAQNTNPKVIISAGVGATPFIDLVGQYGENSIFINCNRKIEEAIGRDLIKSKVSKYLDIVNEYTGSESDVKVGLISADIIINTVGENYKNINYFICGSPAFMKFLRGELTKIGVNKNKIFYEDFGF